MSKAPIDWTTIPQNFGHGAWSFGLQFGDGFSPGSFELRASSEGVVERVHKEISTGDEIVQKMHGKSKEEIDEFYNGRIMKAWEIIGVVKNVRIGRGQAKQTETLRVRRGVQTWNWQFLADQPPQEIRDLYLLVKEFFAPWILGEGALVGEEKQKPKGPVLAAIDGDAVSYKGSRDLLQAAAAMGDALHQLNQVMEDDDQ